KTTAKSLFRQFFQVLLQTLKNRPLRRLFTESALSKGNATLAKDYVQPMLESAAMALPLLLMWEDKRRAGLLVGAVYALLSLLSGLASRGAHAFMKSSGGAQDASRKIWAGYTFAFALGMIALLSGYPGLAAMTLVMVIILQNTWRPILMGRIDAVSDGASGATILSVDSQASSFYVMVAAPLLGWLVDRYGLVPVAFFGFLTSGVMYGRALLSRKVKA
ncbi:MAG: hypothetical protein MI717_07050, partial [Spirochaetales bacterium]|nr:hypothetical protein [Spirochaetales bacterium]